MRFTGVTGSMIGAQPQVHGCGIYAHPAWLVREPEEPYGRLTTKPRLLDQVRNAIRARHYSYRTEEAYVGWIRRYILFHGKRHPAEMGPPEITQFLTALAVAACPGSWRRCSTGRDCGSSSACASA
jgi:hypothetical protein